MDKKIEKGRSLLRDMMPFALGVMFTQSIMVASGKDIIKAILVSVFSVVLGLAVVAIIRYYSKDKDA